LFVNAHKLGSIVVLLLVSFVTYLARAAEKLPAPAAADTRTFQGQVLPLGKALEALGVKADTEPVRIAFVANDKSIYWLVRDKQTNMLFLDPRLQNRPLQLEVRVVPGSRQLQVKAVNTIKDGKLHDVIYWCEGCQLAWTEPGACKCCGAETEIIETPVVAK
jgi:hypothetical protein